MDKISGLQVLDRMLARSRRLAYPDTSLLLKSTSESHEKCNGELWLTSHGLIETFYLTPHRHTETVGHFKQRMELRYVGFFCVPQSFDLRFEWYARINIKVYFCAGNPGLCCCLAFFPFMWLYMKPEIECIGARNGSSPLSMISNDNPLPSNTSRMRQVVRESSQNQA